MELLEDRRFYIYVYFDFRKIINKKYGDYLFYYEPFYIGKGKNVRAWDHIRPAMLKRNNEKSNLLRELKNEGYQITPLIIKKYLTEIEAHNLEKLLVKLIGRKNLNLGPLFNLTDGGEGTNGWKLTKLNLKNKSNAIKGLFLGEKSVLSKSVICVETKKVYGSIREAERETGIFGSVIIDCCNEKTNLAGGFNWSYYYNNGEYIPRNNKPIINKEVRHRETGKIFITSKEADLFFGFPLNTVAQCCNGSRKMARGIHSFEYVNDPHKENYYKDNRRKTKVICIEENRIFKSIKETAIFYNINIKTLDEMLRRKRVYYNRQTKLTFEKYSNYLEDK